MSNPDDRSSTMPGPAERAGLVLEVIVFGLVWHALMNAAPGGSSGGITAGNLLVFAVVAVPVTLVLVALFARLRGQRLADLGLRRPERGWPRALILGVLAGLSLVVVTAPLVPLLRDLGLERLDPFVVDGRGSALVSAVCAVAAGGFMEELVYRGYGFARLERAFASEVRPAQGVVLAALATALVFGATHLYQGGQAVVVVTLWGLGFAVLRQLARGQLVPVMIAHGTINVLAFVARGG